MERAMAIPIPALAQVSPFPVVDTARSLQISENRADAAVWMVKSVAGTRCIRVESNKLARLWRDSGCGRQYACTEHEEGG